jgi:hypothetical protein
LLFEEVELLEATVKIVSYIVPGITVKVDVFVCPYIREIAVI